MIFMSAGEDFQGGHPRDTPAQTRAEGSELTMSNLTTPSVQGYLDELGRALRDLPRGRRREIVRYPRTHRCRSG